MPRAGRLVRRVGERWRRLLLAIAALPEKPLRHELRRSHRIASDAAMNDFSAVSTSGRQIRRTLYTPPVSPNEGRPEIRECPLARPKLSEAACGASNADSCQTPPARKPSSNASKIGAGWRR